MKTVEVLSAFYWAIDNELYKTVEVLIMYKPTLVRVWGRTESTEMLRYVLTLLYDNYIEVLNVEILNAVRYPWWRDDLTNIHLILSYDIEHNWQSIRISSCNPYLCALLLSVFDIDENEQEIVQVLHTAHMEVSCYNPFTCTNT